MNKKLIILAILVFLLAVVSLGCTRKSDSIKTDSIIIETSVPQGDFVEDERSPEEACIPALEEARDSMPDLSCELIASERVDEMIEEKCVDSLSVAGCFTCKIECKQEKDAEEKENRIILDGTLSNLQFESNSDGVGIKRADKIIEEYTGPSWKSVGYEEIGNFYEKSWCKGSNAPYNCAVSSSNANDKGQHVISLYTLHFNDDPEFFGLGFGAKKVPETGWAADFSFSENGKSIIADGYNFNFDYFEESKEPLKSLSFASTYDHQVYDKTIYYSSTAPLRNDVKKFLSSAESMRDIGLKQLDALSKKVYDYIPSAARCGEWEYYENDNFPKGAAGAIPPKCIEERPLTEDEKKESLAKAQEYFSEQENMLNENYKEMYNALVETFPFEVFD